MIDLEVCLKAVHGFDRTAEQTAGVVCQHIDAGIRQLELGGQFANIIEAGEICQIVVGSNLGRDCPCLLRRSPYDHDTMAILVKFARSSRAYAVAGAGDNDGPGHGRVLSL